MFQLSNAMRDQVHALGRRRDVAKHIVVIDRQPRRERQHAGAVPGIAYGAPSRCSRVIIVFSGVQASGIR